MIATIDVIRSLRNKTSYQVILNSQIPLSGDSAQSILVSAIDKAWRLASDRTVYLTQGMIIPYLPSEMKSETQHAVNELIVDTNDFYDTERSLELARALLIKNKVTQFIESAYREGSTPLEESFSGRDLTKSLSLLDIQLEKAKYSTNDGSSNSRTLTKRSLNSVNRRSKFNKAFFHRTIDNVIGSGLKEGSCSMLIAPTGTGKSTLASCIAGYNFRVGKKILFVSLEEDENDIYDKILFSTLQVPQWMTLFNNFERLLRKHLGDDIPSYEVMFRILNDIKADSNNSLSKIHQTLTSDTFLSPQATTLLETPSNPKIDQLIDDWISHMLNEIKSIEWPMSFDECMNCLAVAYDKVYDNFLFSKVSKAGGLIDVEFIPPITNNIVSAIENVISTSDTDYDLVILDHLNAIDENSSSVRHDVLKRISTSLDIIAKRYKCAVLMTAQSTLDNKLSQKKSKTPPTLGDRFNKLCVGDVAESKYATWCCYNVFSVFVIRRCPGCLVLGLGIVKSRGGVGGGRNFVVVVNYNTGEYVVESYEGH